MPYVEAHITALMCGWVDVWGVFGVLASVDSDRLAIARGGSDVVPCQAHPQLGGMPVP